MTVEDLRNIIKPFPEFEIIYQEDPKDRIEFSEQAAVHITLRHKKSFEPVYVEKMLFGYFDTVNSFTPKNRSKFEAINDCCMRIMHNLIAVGLYEQYKIIKELRKTHGY